jgi:hypothetical protein
LAFFGFETRQFGFEFGFSVPPAVEIADKIGFVRRIFKKPPEIRLYASPSLNHSLSIAQNKNKVKV